MRALTETDIRGSFVNAGLDDLVRLALPDLSRQPWADLDFLGWVDPAQPRKAWMVMDYADSTLGLMLRTPTSAVAPRRSMCNLCHSVQPRGGVRLMTAPREGEAGRRHNMVGTYLCADLDCSLYVRGMRQLQGFSQIPELLSPERKIQRLRERLNDFVARVLAPMPDVPVGEQG